MFFLTNTFKSRNGDLQMNDLKIKLTKAVNNISKMGYLPNSQQNPQHEDGVKWELEECGFVENIDFVSQPNGKQKFPDFHILDDGNVVLELECKSATKKKPMWNRGLPKPDALYIVCSRQLGRTTIFFGENVLPRKTFDRLMKIDKDIKAQVNMINDEHDDGWINYPRLAFDNRGDNSPNYWDRSYIDIVLSKLDTLDVRV